ncbi:MAG: serine/threonine protein kinase, partial [Planctomycetes bacterium]|nr:serine/threonine protein kinase [Planctomycetota bacterium]
MSSAERLFALFEEAYELPIGQVEAFLRRQAKDSPELIERVVVYLKAAPDRPDLAALLGGIGEDEAVGPRVVDRLRRLRRKMHPQPVEHESNIGPYRLLQPIGEGGMGTVYLADQKEPVQRRVAVKVVRRGRESSALLGRFERERQALAMMSHPNIAKVLDAGTTVDGRPYFVMELVQGDPISKYCDKHKQSVEERLRLFLQVCHGVQHAHHKGVIHRDLKPDNILVEILDHRPVARIIDFGLARAANPMDMEYSVHTEFGQILGTLPYMSPEQAEMSGTDVDTRTDIYSLGVLLYELLTGTLPFSDQELRSAGLQAFQRRIREEEPALPSRRVSSSGESASELGRFRRVSDVALVRRLRNELDWIVMKCLEKDRARRYQTPSELAADIERHLDGEQVLAGRPTAVYRIRRMLWRHRILAGVLTTVIVTLTVALTVVTAARNAEAQQRHALELAHAELDERMALSEADHLLGQGRQLSPLTWKWRGEAGSWLPASRELIDRVAAMHRHEIADPDRRAAQAVVRSKLDAAVAELGQAAGEVGERMDLLRDIEGRYDDRWPAVVDALKDDPRFAAVATEPWTGL